MDLSEESEEKEPERPEIEPKNKMVVGVLTASVSLVVVLFLMARAVQVSVPEPEGRAPGTSKQNEPNRIKVERVGHRYRTSAGIPELEVTGTIRNTGPSSVQSADLRCHFKSRTGEDSFREIPLIIPTHLPDVSEGALEPFSARRFGVRIGGFPSNLKPEVLDAKPVNIHFAQL